MRISVLTWNLFHARDGHPTVGATWASTLLGRRVEGGDHIHLNRKLVEPMGEAIARWAPDIAALQEVPTAAIETLAARAGMSAVWVTTGPLLGPRGVRDRWAAANPDLWRTHEGNANVLLVGPRLRVVAGSVRRVRLNPLAGMAAVACRARMPAREVMHWLGEHRAVVALRAKVADGRRIVVAGLHCHNSHVPEVVRSEIAVTQRVMSRLAHGGPALMAGDFNAHPDHPAMVGLAVAGWRDAGTPRGIDRILHRGLEVVDAPRVLAHHEHEVLVPHRGRWRRVRLSDHAPVMATYGLERPSSL